jgi:sulfoxide reductase heme-binding subunit YedZ
MPLRWTAIRVGVFLLALLPFLWLLQQAALGRLGADPADALMLETGRWSLRLLLLTLAVTPLRDLTGLGRIGLLRRMLGLYAFFYAVLHFLVYLFFLLELRWSEIAGDILQRPYITVGFLSFLILLVLAATSFKAAMRRLGRRWKALHRLVYVAAVLAVLHLTWILRTDLADAFYYGMILALLLGYRLFRSKWSVRLRSRLAGRAER